MNSKKDNILKFIRLAILRPEQIDAILPSFLPPSGGNQQDMQQLQERARERILSDEHLEQFIPAVDKIFSEEEIERLVKFYQDEAVGKYFTQGGAIGSAVYMSLAEVVQSIK